MQVHAVRSGEIRQVSISNSRLSPSEVEKIREGEPMKDGVLLPKSRVSTIEEFDQWLHASARNKELASRRSPVLVLQESPKGDRYVAIAIAAVQGAWGPTLYTRRIQERPSTDVSVAYVREDQTLRAAAQEAKR